MKKRIGILVPEFRTSAAPGGGVATVADFVYSAFKEENQWEVEFISPRMWSNAKESQRIRNFKSWLSGPRTRASVVDDAKVTYVGSYFAEIEVLRNLPRRVLRQKLSTYDAVVVVCGTPAIINSVRGFKKPLIAQIATTVQVERKRLVSNGSMIRRLYSLFNRAVVYQLDKIGVRIPDLVLVENPWMEDWAKSHGAQNVALEMPGIETEFFNPGSKVHLEESERYVLSVARLNEARKDFGLLIRAYAEAVEKHGVTQKLVLAGRNDLLPEVYEEIERLGVGAKVEVRREISQEELRDLYRGADVFAMSSSEEGLGLVLIESLACGTPIVSTATEGAKSVMQTAGVGTLIDFGDSVQSELAKAIADAVKDETRLMEQSTEARVAAVEHFSMVSAGNRFRRALTEVLAVEN